MLKFKIILADRNDNSPTFDLVHYTHDISESKKEYMFDIMPASDKDMGDNANITLVLIVVCLIYCNMFDYNKYIII